MQPPAPVVAPLTTGDTNVREPSLERAARQLRGARLAFYIGTQTDSATAFGDIADATLGARGEILILDRGLGRVAAFDDTGRYVGAIGQGGSAEQDLDSPHGLVRATDGRLIVLELNARLKYFADAAGGFAYQGTAATGNRVEGACTIGRVLYVRGLDSAGHVVQTIESDGVTIRAFAQGYRHPSQLVRGQLSRGRIACDSASGRVIVSMNSLPYITAYDADGTVAWTLTLTPFQPMRTESWTEPRETVRRSRSTPYDLPVTLLSIAPDVLFLQVAHLKDRVAEVGMPTVSSYVVSVRRGIGMYVGETLPIISAVTRGRALAIEPRPFPRVAVYETAP